MFDKTDLDLCTADFFFATKGRFTLSVSWLPERDPSGQFVCKVFLDGNADAPLEELKTVNPEKMATWASKQMQEISKRS